MSTTLPLKGIRVLELSVAWAAPFCGKNLAYLGAEVVKVEAPYRPDGHRGSIFNPTPGVGATYPQGEPGERPWNRTGTFHERYRSKLDISLDLAKPEGRDAFRELVGVSDVVLVNYRAGVMDNLGLGYDALKEINPQIIMALLPGFGLTGPYRDYSSYGSNLEALTGAMGLTGYPDRDPLNSNLTWPDPMVGVMAMGMICAAIRHRKTRGEGMLVEFSQMEATVRAMAGFLMDYQMNGRVAQRDGNRHPIYAPHGVFRCKGDDQWLAVVVRYDHEWEALCKVMGKPELSHDPRFADCLARLHHVDDVERVVEAWTMTQDKVEAMRALQQAGVAAGPVMPHYEHFTNPQYQARGVFQEISHPEAGTFLFQGIAGYRLSKTPGYNQRHAPLFGEHNRYLLHDVLGMTEDQVADLEKKEVISEVPLGENARSA